MTAITRYLKRTEYQTANNPATIRFLYLWNCGTQAFSNDKAPQFRILFGARKTLHEPWAGHVALQEHGDSDAALDQELAHATHPPW